MDRDDFCFISIAITNHPSRFDRTAAFLPNRSNPFIYGHVIGVLVTVVQSNITPGQPLLKCIKYGFFS